MNMTAQSLVHRSPSLNAVRYESFFNPVLLQKASSLLDDALFYLERIGAEAYTMPVPFLSGSTIGQHTRHIIEFFQCLIEQTAGSGRQVNYDLRRRDALLETSPLRAFASIRKIRQILPELEVSGWLAVHDCGRDDETAVLIPSSAARELLYVIEHTIHHFALVRAALYHAAPALQMPVHFGVAPSTLKYRDQNKNK